MADAPEPAVVGVWEQLLEKVGAPRLTEGSADALANALPVGSRGVKEGIPETLKEGTRDKVESGLELAVPLAEALGVTLEERVMLTLPPLEGVGFKDAIATPVVESVGDCMGVPEEELVGKLEGEDPPPPAAPPPPVGVMVGVALPLLPKERLLRAEPVPLKLAPPLPVAVAHAERVGVVDTVGVPVNTALTVEQPVLEALMVPLGKALSLTVNVSVPPLLPLQLALTVAEDETAPPVGLLDWLCTWVPPSVAEWHCVADIDAVPVEDAKEVVVTLPPPKGVLVGDWEGLGCWVRDPVLNPLLDTEVEKEATAGVALTVVLMHPLEVNEGARALA